MQETDYPASQPAPQKREGRDLSRAGTGRKLQQRPVCACAGQPELQAHTEATLPGRKGFKPYRLAFFSCVTQPLRVLRALETGELVGKACAGLIGQNQRQQGPLAESAQCVSQTLARAKGLGSSATTLRCQACLPARLPSRHRQINNHHMKFRLKAWLRASESDSSNPGTQSDTVSKCDACASTAPGVVFLKSGMFSSCSYLFHLRNAEDARSLRRKLKGSVTSSLDNRRRCPSANLCAIITAISSACAHSTAVHIS